MLALTHLPRLYLLLILWSPLSWTTTLVSAWAPLSLFSAVTKHKTNHVPALLRTPHQLLPNEGIKPKLLREAQEALRPGSRIPLPPHPNTILTYTLCSSNYKLLKISCLYHTLIYLYTLPLLGIFISIFFAWISPTQHSTFRFSITLPKAIFQPQIWPQW